MHGLSSSAHPAQFSTRHRWLARRTPSHVGRGSVWKLLRILLEAVSKPCCHPEGGSATEGSTLPPARFFATLRFTQNDSIRRRKVLKTLLVIGLALGCLICPAHTASAQAPVPSGTVITIAGNGVGGFSGDGGPALDASLNGHYGSAIGPDGTLYFADSDNCRIRAVNPATGIITTVAGNGSIGDHNSNDGPATAADLGYVISVAVDRAATRSTSATLARTG